VLASAATAESRDRKAGQIGEAWASSRQSIGNREHSYDAYFHIGGTAAALPSRQAWKPRTRHDQFHQLQTVRNQEGFLVAMNRNGVLAIMDEKGREKERYTIVYGAKLKVNEGDHVKVGATLVEWDPTPSRF
jgi:hypothetical protein